MKIQNLSETLGHTCTFFLQKNRIKNAKFVVLFTAKRNFGGQFESDVFTHLQIFCKTVNVMNFPKLSG